MSDKKLIFTHNCTIWISKCVILCKNPHKRGEKYRIEFSFIGGKKYSVEFNNKNARDKHYRFIARMMYMNYTPSYREYIHWLIHAMCLYTIVRLAILIMG